jgi:hypothetical protein
MIGIRQRARVVKSDMVLTRLFSTTQISSKADSKNALYLPLQLKGQRQKNR